MFRLAYFFVLGAAASVGLASQPVLKVGDKFPDLNQFELEGDCPESLKGKVVVMEFWASWCGRCKGSFAVMEDLQTRFGNKGLVVLGINVDESRTAMQEFLKEHPVTFNVLRDKTKSLVRTVNIPSMPTLLVLDVEGNVHSIHQSLATSEARAKFIAEVKALLKVPTGG